MSNYDHERDSYYNVDDERFYEETLYNEEYYITALTNIFIGRPARGIVNQIMKELGPINAAAPAFPLATSAIAHLAPDAFLYIRITSLAVRPLFTLQLEQVEIRSGPCNRLILSIAEP